MKNASFKNMKTFFVFVHNLCLTEPTKDVWPGFLLEVFTLPDFPGVSKGETVFCVTVDSQKPEHSSPFPLTGASGLELHQCCVNYLLSD